MMAATIVNPERQNDGLQPKLYHPRLRQRGIHNDDMVKDSHDDNDVAADKNLSVESARLISAEEKNANLSLSGAFQCGICSQKLCSMDQLLSHMEDHGKEDVFQCNMCNDIFSRAESLSAHLDLHTNVVKAFKCGICNAGFLENAALMSHLKQKHEVLPFLYKCNICLLLFKEISKLISHAAKRHPPVCKEYRCGLCDKKFSQGSRLTLHVQKHSENDFQQSKYPTHQAQVPPKKSKMHLKSHDKSNDVRTGSRKTRSNIRQHQQQEFPEKSKNKNKRHPKKSKLKLPAVNKNEHDDVSEDFHAVDSEDEEDYDNEDVDVAALRSSKRRKKSPTVKMKLQEEKKLAIKSDEELIATYRRIDPKTQNEVFDCDACGLRFYECISFTQHRADHFFDDKYCINCQHCEQVFDNFEDLNGHVGEGKCCGYVCPTCGKSFSLEPFLLTHQVKEHNMCQKKNGSSLICSTCDKICDNRTAFLRHASSHSEIKCIECKLCRHSFTTPETLYGHLRTTHSLIPLTRKKYSYSCKECNIDFMRIEALQNHEALVHHFKTQEPDIMQPIAEPKRSKPKVNRIIESQMRKTGHWRSAEDDKKRRTCHICNRVFRRFKDVRRHIGTHTKPYLCSHCGKAFPYRYSLDAHIKAFHSAENPFKCEVCMKYFSCPRSLIVHQRIHTGERPHQCHICHKRFRQVANLSMHVKLHNADKPIQCPLCDYRCRHRGYLKRHMSTHSKEKKHFCPICNKGFTEKPNLNHHLKRHAKIKNHVCAVCGHRFAERYYLNNHMRIHTKEKPYVCPVCNRAFTMRPNMVSHIKKTHPSYKYQPIRPSHQTVAVAGNDNNSSSSLPETSLPSISEANTINQACITTSGPAIPPPPPPQASSLPQLPPNIPIYHATELPHSKVNNHSYPPRDSILQTPMLRDQQQQPLMREPEMITDPIAGRNQGILREPIMGQNMLLEDPERRHYINNMPSNRMPETSGFDTQRDVSGQNYPVVLQGQEYMYTYPNLPPDPFIQGFFPIPNQHSQHPQQKPLN